MRGHGRAGGRSGRSPPGARRSAARSACRGPSRNPGAWVDASGEPHKACYHVLEGEERRKKRDGLEPITVLKWRRPPCMRYKFHRFALNLAWERTSLRRLRSMPTPGREMWVFSRTVPAEKLRGGFRCPSAFRYGVSESLPRPVKFEAKTVAQCPLLRHGTPRRARKTIDVSGIAPLVTAAS